MLVKRPTVRRAMRNPMLLYSLLAAMYVPALPSGPSSLGPTGFGTLWHERRHGRWGHSDRPAGPSSQPSSPCAAGLAYHDLPAASVSLSLSRHPHACTLLGIGRLLHSCPDNSPGTHRKPKRESLGLQNNLINIALSLPLVLAGTLVRVSDLSLCSSCWLPWQRGTFWRDPGSAANF